VEQLRGRNALLTGAAGGLGAYIARALAAEGVNLALSDLPEASLDRLLEELGGKVRAESVPADLTIREEAEGLVARAEQALGPLDILVNNAGLEFSGDFQELAPEEIEALVQVNLLATMLTTHAALPGMRERGRGHVVNIASMAGKALAPNLAIYSASKHGVVGFTHSLRAEYGPEPVGFSAICPTLISRVGMYGRLESRLERPPPGLRALPPERVGEAVVRAVGEDRAEILVANPLVRPLVALSALTPRLFARLSGNRRTREYAEQFARVKEEAPPTLAEQHVRAKAAR
jgi:short-subunit dehydrogenase